MIDYNNARFDFTFKMSPPHRLREFEAITLNAVPGILAEVREWHESCNRSWSGMLDDKKVACTMSVTAVYGDRGAEYIAEAESEQAEEILAELENVLYSSGCAFDRDTPLIHNNAELHTGQVYFD